MNHPVPKLRTFHYRLLSYVFICFFLLLSFAHIHLDSWTVDEPLHIKSGIEWLEQGYSPTDPYNPPASKLIYGLMLRTHSQWLIDPFLVVPRLFSLVLSLILLLTLFNWVKLQYSSRTAFFAVALLTLEPNFLAYSHLATTDIASALVYFLVITSIYRWHTAPSKRSLFTFWIMMALCASTKLVLLPAVALVYILAKPFKLGHLKQLFSPLPFLTALVLIWAMYGFHFRTIGQFTPPLPLGEFFSTIARTANYVFNPKYDQTRFLFYFGVTRGYGWWSYPLVSLLLKTSPTLIFFLGSKLAFRSKIKPLLLPVTSLLLLVSLGRYSTGVRHLLPVYPFLAILGAKGADHLVSNRHSLLVTFILIFTLLVRITSQDYISYFNPLIGSRAGGRIIADSNLDWGQNLYRLYLEQGDTIDYIASRSPIHPLFYGLHTQVLPLPADLNPAKVLGKKIAISRHLWYVLDYQSLPMFQDQTPEYAADNTFFIFTF